MNRIETPLDVVDRLHECTVQLDEAHDELKESAAAFHHATAALRLAKAAAFLDYKDRHPKATVAEIEANVTVATEKEALHLAVATARAEAARDLRFLWAEHQRAAQSIGAVIRALTENLE